MADHYIALIIGLLVFLGSLISVEAIRMLSRLLQEFDYYKKLDTSSFKWLELFKR